MKLKSVCCFQETSKTNQAEDCNGIQLNSATSVDCKSASAPISEPLEEYFEEIPLWVAILTYVSYAILIVYGHFRDLLRYWRIERMPLVSEPVREVRLFLFSTCVYC